MSTRRLAALAAVVMPAPALACAVCFAGEERTRTAFLATTIALSLLPFVLVGGVAWLLRRPWATGTEADGLVPDGEALPPPR